MTPARAWRLARRGILGLSLLGTVYLLSRFDSRLAPGLAPGTAHRVVLDTWSRAWAPRDRLLHRDAAGRVAQGWFVEEDATRLMLAPSPFIEGPERVEVDPGAVLGRVVMVVSELTVAGREVSP
ncbi:MAG: hypothetical protein ISQ08_01775 [Planctomycetes bacterium]|nr:hypothetical protein [Planctomycetota bacterium]